MANRAHWGTEGLFNEARRIRLRSPDVGLYGVIARLNSTARPAVSSEEIEAIRAQFFAEQQKRG